MRCGGLRQSLIGRFLNCCETVIRNYWEEINELHDKDFSLVEVFKLVVLNEGDRENACWCINITLVTVSNHSLIDCSSSAGTQFTLQQGLLYWPLKFTVAEITVLLISLFFSLQNRKMQILSLWILFLWRRMYLCYLVRPAQVKLNEGQQLCVVCSDVGNGVHFGALTCEGCKVKKSAFDNFFTCNSCRNFVYFKYFAGCLYLTRIKTNTN